MNGDLESATFRAAFELNPQAMWILDCATAGLVAINEAALAQLACGRAELAGSTLHDLRSTDAGGPSTEAVAALCADLPGPNPTVRSLHLRRGDGTDLTVEVSSHALASPEVRRLCIVRDVTEGRHAKRAESRYQSLLQNSRDKVIFFTPDGRILECNDLATRAYGYSRDELLKMRVSDLRDPATEQEVGRQLARANEHGLHFETSHRRRDGTCFPVEVHSRGVMLGGERVLVSVIRDISDERKARAVLRSVEQRLRLMLEDAPLAVVVLDSDGLIEYANPFFLSLTGRSWPQVVGRRAFGAFRAAPPGSPARSHFQGELVTATGVRQLSWTQSTLRDAGGAAEGFLYIGSDMTEHWHAQRALRLSEQRFRALTEGNPDGMALCTDDKITYANPALAALLGKSTAALLGRPALELVHPGDRGELQARLARAFTQAEPMREMRLLREGGGSVDAEVALLRIEADGLVSVLLVARDVTERWQLQSRLLQASRLASVGTLAAGVAHEINNPLAWVDANLSYVGSIWPRVEAELLGRRAGAFVEPAPQEPLTPAALDEVRDAIAESGIGLERVRQTVAGLKQFALSEAEAPRPVDVRLALEASLKMIAHELGRRARVVRELSPVPAVMGNEARLAQVFVNLLLNAAQALPPEGDPAQAMVSVRSFVDGQGRVIVAVEDSGRGIAEENLARIFDPFFTTRAVGEGAGLGLSIAHGIISGMGGDIEVTSTVGAGTLVKVILPPAPFDRSST